MAKRTKSQLGRYKRSKGASYERWIANVLKELWPEARRGIGQSRNAGEVPDVDGTPYWIEAKHHRRVNIRKAFEQALEAKLLRHSGRPVLVIAKDTGRAPDLVTMDLLYFVSLMREVLRLRKAFDDEVGA